jgi:hypothetical protein
MGIVFNAWTELQIDNRLSHRVENGAYTAEPALHARSQTPNAKIPDTIYNVYEAKKQFQRPQNWELSEVIRT